MVEYGTTDEYGYRSWPVEYPDDCPVWTVTYQGGVVTGTIAQPCEISVRLGDGMEPDLRDAVAADSTLPPLVRAAKAAAEHVRLFMSPNGWLGDDDEPSAVVYALDLLTNEVRQPVSLDRTFGPECYQVVVLDQLGFSFDLMAGRHIRTRLLALLAPVMHQDRNAAVLVKHWAWFVSHRIHLTPEDVGWEDHAAEFGELAGRERTLLVQAIDALLREPGSPFGGQHSDFLSCWEQITEVGSEPLGLRRRLGLYPTGHSPAI